MKFENATIIHNTNGSTKKKLIAWFFKSLSPSILCACISKNAPFDFDIVSHHLRDLDEFWGPWRSEQGHPGTFEDVEGPF